MKIYKIAGQLYSYVTSCVESNNQSITDMIESPVEEEVSYEEFMSNVSRDEIKSLFPIYDWEEGTDGFTLQNDYHVSYHKSKFEGYDCYYMVHSAIEWVFIR